MLLSLTYSEYISGNLLFALHIVHELLYNRKCRHRRLEPYGEMWTSAILRKLTKLHDQITFSVFVFEEKRKYELDSIFYELFENHIT